MATQGRKRKPDRAKILEGTFRKDRANPAAPDEDQAGMVVPPWLPADALEHFLTVKERLAVYKLDSASWTEAAALIAMRINEIEICSRVIEAEGRTYTSETAMDKPVIGTDGEPYFPVKRMIKGHPIVNQKNEAMRHLQSLLSEFGLTPAAIAKVGKKDGDSSQKDPWESFG